MSNQRKRCKCLDCNGMGFTAAVILGGMGAYDVNSKVECQSCLSTGWLYERDFKKQVSHRSDIDNLAVVEAYENGPSEEIPYE